jgi:hypothetical protein
MESFGGNRKMTFRLSGFFAVAALAAAMASTASASELCAGVSDVTTIAAAGGCTVSGSTLLFNNFDVSASAGFTSATIGISSASFGTAVFGSDVDLAFQIGGLSDTIPAPQSVVDATGDIQLAYTVTGGIIGLDMVVQASPVLPGGSLTVSEVACTAAFVADACSGTTLANFTVTSSGLPASKTELFTTSYSGEVYILKDLSYDGATTSSLVNSQVVSTVPEPMTFSLLGAGLLGLGLVGRRRLQK